MASGLGLLGCLAGLVIAIVPAEPALVYSKLARRLMSEWLRLQPEGGWKAFVRSDELTSFLWSRLGTQYWHYLNLTSTTSVWEHRGEPEGMVVVDYSGEGVEDLRVCGLALEEVTSELATTFGLNSIENA
ncbi:hypothetical protein EP7_000055 [Isosphaeraceae bacterium EP7]